MGKGLIPAIIALILPAFLIVYYSPNSDVVNILSITAFGAFYVFHYSNYVYSDPSLNTKGQIFLPLNPGWYTDLHKVMTEYEYSSDPETLLAETGALSGVVQVYGNFKEVVIDSTATEYALGTGGMLMAAFVLLMVGGILLNLIGQEKISGFLFLGSGVASLAALLLTWSMLSGWEAMEGDFFPVPLGALFLLFAGIRGILAKPEDAAPTKKRTKRK